MAFHREPPFFTKKPSCIIVIIVPVHTAYISSGNFLNYPLALMPSRYATYYYADMYLRILEDRLFSQSLDSIFNSGRLRLLMKRGKKKKINPEKDIGLMQNGERSLFAEEMGDGREYQGGQRERPAEQRAGKRKRMYICRLSERIKTERIANGFPFQSVDRRGNVDSYVPSPLLPITLSLSLSFSLSGDSDFFKFFGSQFSN
ncbi:hypothetical protein PUN28_007431 [Cardiocondyla obscurior]|uniref:Uncharacterized protein n=1 Tax=Cardiocondyla obscurior TaxID=286306 RepID=A0AAW2G6Y3_9HYME